MATMKFKVMNLSTKKIEDMYADNEQNVIDLYKLQGVEVKVMGVVDVDTQNNENNMNATSGQVDEFGIPVGILPGTIPTPQHGVPNNQIIPTPQPRPKEIKFKVMGQEVKLMPDGVYIKQWVDLDEAEYRVTSKKTRKVSTDYNVQIKDWVKSDE